MHENMLFPWRGECDSDQCPRWSSGYDAHPDNKRPGFNPPMRQIIFFGLCHSLNPLLLSYCNNNSSAQKSSQTVSGKTTASKSEEMESNWQAVAISADEGATRTAVALSS